MIPICRVLCYMHDQNGNPEAGATFEAVLNSFEIYNGYVVPERVKAVANEEGFCELLLWPNQLGALGSAYDIRMKSTTGRILVVHAVVPALETANLHEVAGLPVYPGKFDGQVQVESALEAAIAASNSATTALGVLVGVTDQATVANASVATSTAAATSADASMAAATIAKDQSVAANDAAQISATDAAASQASATASAATATTQAATATTQATTATTKATSATTSATTATTQAASATTSAATATTQATAATTKAAEALASASTATTKAGEASASAALINTANFVPIVGGVVMAGPLSVPAGATGANAPQAQETALLASFSFSNRNKLINSNFLVNQLSKSGSVVLGAYAYGHDQWFAGPGGCTYVFGTVGGMTTVNILSGTLQQGIEGSELIAGSYVLSWLGTATGRIGGGVYVYGSGGATAVLAGGAVWNIEFGIGTVALPQLERGTAPTLWSGRLVVDELSACQRYYETGYASVYQGQAASYRASCQVNFNTLKRVVPTIVLTVSSTNGFGVPNAIVVITQGFMMEAIATTTTADGRMVYLWTASARL